MIEALAAGAAAMGTQNTGRFDVERASSVSTPVPPSGAWFGYSIDLPDSQPLHQTVTLAFLGGKVSGEGQDRDGPFTIVGSYLVESGAVSWVKTHGSRAVDCRGYFERGAIWGTWEAGPGARGGFQVWPVTDGQRNLTTRERLDAVASELSKALSRLAGRRGVPPRYALEEFFGPR